MGNRYDDLDTLGEYRAEYIIGMEYAYKHAASSNIAYSNIIINWIQGQSSGFLDGFNDFDFSFVQEKDGKECINLKPGLGINKLWIPFEGYYEI